MNSYLRIKCVLNHVSWWPTFDLLHENVKTHVNAKLGTEKHCELLVFFIMKFLVDVDPNRAGIISLFCNIEN